jgi:peptidoglycan/LPS O-acetylase OafA/YrhL
MDGADKLETFRRRFGRTLFPSLLFRRGNAAEPGSPLLRVTSGRFRPEIDGLRFFAIVPVLFSHLFQQVLRRQNHLGFLDDAGVTAYTHYFVNHLPGVLLFFAISGYILTYQITNASRGGYTWGKYANYIVRRFKRIAPPYYIVLIATFIVVAILGFRPSGGRSFEASQVPLFPSLLVSFFYSHWFVYGEWPRLFGAGWTLEIETQYYVIAPALTLIYLKLSNKALRTTIGVTTVVFTSAIAAQFEVGNFWAGTIAKFFPYFFTGMLALDLQDELRDIVKTVPSLVTNGLTVLVVFFYVHTLAPESGAGIEMFTYYMINIACVLAMFVAVSIEGNILRRICVNRYVVIIGGACYSIYMTHYQVIFLLMSYFTYKHFIFEKTYLAMLFNAAVEFPIAVIVGLTFYRYVEKPFMMWGRTSRMPQPQIALASQPGNQG